MQGKGKQRMILDKIEKATSKFCVRTAVESGDASVDDEQVRCPRRTFSFILG